VERAVDSVISAGARTADLGGSLSTTAFGEKVRAELR